MIDSSQELTTIKGQIEQLKMEERKIGDKMKSDKIKEKRELRLTSNNNGKTNKLRRVSNNFSNKLDYINKKREENGFDHLSNPKITELIVKHKSYWKPIEDDIVFFNIKLDLEELDSVEVKEQDGK